LLSQVETILETTRETLRVYVRQGWLPRPRRLGKVLFWRVREFEAALAAAGRDAKWVGPEDGAAVGEVDAA